MKRDIFKDKNLKVSSKRIIAIISFINSLILCYLFIFKNIGNLKLISMFLLAGIGEGFACSLERKH